MGLLERMARFSTRRAALLFVAALLSLLPSLFLAERLEFESSLTALLPEDYQAVKDLRAGEERTGGVAHAVIAIGAQDRPVAERYADALGLALETLEEVRFVEARLDTDFIERHQLLYAGTDTLDELLEELTDEIDARKVEGAGLGLGLERPDEGLDFDLRARFREAAKALGLPAEPYRYGKDGRYLYVFVAVTGDAGDLGNARVVQAKLEETARRVRDQGSFPPELELRFTGSVVVRLEDNDNMTRDLGRASVLAFLAVVLLLVAYTRRVRTLVVLSVPLVVGLAFTLAFAELTFGRLNIISGFLISILSGLGIEFGIHLLLRHTEERRRGLAAEAAQHEAMQTTGRSLLGSAGTNAGAFFVVSLAGFQGFSEFGLIAGVGLLVTALVTLLVFPAVNLSLERIWPMKVLPLEPPTSSGRGRRRLPRGLRFLILVGMPAFALFSVLALLQGEVRFRTNWREIKGVSPASEFEDYVSESLGSTFTQTMIFVADDQDLPKVARVVDEVSKRRVEGGQPSGISGTFSLADLVPAEQTAKLTRIAALEKQLLRVDAARLEPADREKLEHALSLTKAQAFGPEALPVTLTQRFRTTNGEGSLLIVRSSYRFYESAEVAEWAEEMSALHEALRESGLAAPIVSENWIAGTVFQIIYQDGPFILGGTLLIVFLVVLLDLRRLHQALVVLASLLLGFVSIAGGMALFDMELNFINSAVLPLVVGVSIDNSLHIFHRFRRDGPDAITRGMRFTVSATTLSSAANLMGFGSMIIAHHRGLRSVAELAILGIGLTYLSTSVFLPLALEAWTEWRRRPQAVGSSSSSPPREGMGPQ